MLRLDSLLSELPYALSVAVLVAAISLGVHALLRDATPRTEPMKVGQWYCCLGEERPVPIIGVVSPGGGVIAAPAGP